MSEALIRAAGAELPAIPGRWGNPTPTPLTPFPVSIRALGRGRWKRTPLHPHPTATPPAPSIPSLQPAFSRLQTCRSPSPYLNGAWPGWGGRVGAGEGALCPERIRAASFTERGQRLPYPLLSLLAGEEPGYSQPLVCVYVGVCVCTCTRYLQPGDTARTALPCIPTPQ